MPTNLLTFDGRAAAIKATVAKYQGMPQLDKVEEGFISADQIKANILTTIAARHTFSPIMMQNGASTEFIKDSDGHANVKTTENYLSSFDEEIKREFAGKLPEF